MSAAVALAFAAETLIMIALPVVAVVVACRRRSVSAAVPLVSAGFYLANLVVNPRW